MRRTRYGWRYNAHLEQFETPSGPLSLEALLRPYWGMIEGHLDFRNEWHGWKLRQQFLRGPGGIRLTPRMCREFWRSVK